MPDLSFIVDKAQPVAYAASPMLNFSLRVSDSQKENARQIHSVALRCQLRIEPTRRQYEPEEKDQLRDLFGEPSRWGQTLRAMLWANASVVVPPFTGETIVDLLVPCTYDFNIAAMKYFYALEDGDVPLNLLFSGTIFYKGDDGELQVEQISWEKEASFRLPIKTWRDMMEMYYPNSAWLCLRRDAFDLLYKFKSENSLPTWEAAIEKLVREAEVKAPG